MEQLTPLIATIVIGLVLAFVFATIANRLKASPIVGYLLAGVAVGPFTPGFVADQALASQLAEVGIILLMFGVGLHFSLKDLLSVRRIVLAGATAQMLVATLLGLGVARLFGWTNGGGVVFGLTLSVASTVVVMRSLQNRHLVSTGRGRVVVGWLVYQDLLTVVALVLLPPLSGPLNGAAASSVSAGALALQLGITLGKVAAFIALMLVVGRRVIPWILHYIAHTGSRELFRLAVLALALGVASAAAALFGVSFALGAFFAGMVLSESELSQRAAEETLPLRDAFAVLFFVSVGMLLDPGVLLHEPLHLAATLLVVAASAGMAFVMARILGAPAATALLVAAGLAQIGEFSFVLADLGIGLGVLPAHARDLILGVSILTILANPLLLAAVERRHRPVAPAGAPEPEELRPTALREHAVLVGYGRVGRLVGDALRQAGWPLLVVENDAQALQSLAAQQIEALPGNAAEERVLAAANLPEARLLLIAIPEAFEASEIVRRARQLNARLPIVARAHYEAAVDELVKYGADIVIMGEREIALSMIEHARGYAAQTAARSNA